MPDKKLTLVQSLAFRLYAYCVTQQGGLIETGELSAFVHYHKTHLLPRVVVVPQAGYTHKGERY